MATASVLRLNFLTDEDKKVQISVSNPKQPVDNTAVDNALDIIVQKDIFSFSQGKIAKKVGAELTETSTTAVGTGA